MKKRITLCLSVALLLVFLFTSCLTVMASSVAPKTQRTTETETPEVEIVPEVVIEDYYEVILKHNNFNMDEILSDLEKNYKNYIVK